MIIKSFMAESASQALKTIREEMGSDAIVLRTRRMTSGADRGRIEVTACLEKASVGQTSEILSDYQKTERFAKQENRSIESTVAATVAEPVPGPTSEPEPKDTISPTDKSAIDDAEPATIDNDLSRRLTAIEKSLDQLTRRATYQSAFVPDTATAWLFDRLINADVDRELAEKLIANFGPEQDQASSSRQKVLEDFVLSLTQVIEEEIEFEAGDRVVFIGPAGSGKSSLMGKLAAYLVSNRRMRVTLASIDSQRIAAHDELATYSAILGLPIADIERDKAKPTDSDGVILIDAPSFRGKATYDDAVVAQIEAIGATHRIAVFSALTRTGDTADIADRMRLLEPTHFAMTMLDQTHRVGSFLSVWDKLGVKLAMLSDAPGGIGSLQMPTISKMSNLLTGDEDKHEQA